MTAATSVNASEIKKEEVENIFFAEQDGYTVSHGKEVTIKFNIKEDIDDLKNEGLKRIHVQMIDKVNSVSKKTDAKFCLDYIENDPQ